VNHGFAVAQPRIVLTRAVPTFILPRATDARHRLDFLFVHQAPMLAPPTSAPEARM